MPKAITRKPNTEMLLRTTGAHGPVAPKLISSLLVATTAIWLSGCTESDIGTVNATPVSEGLAMSAKYQSPPYVISDNDDLTVRLYFNPQLDEDVRVRPDGKISLSLIGEVDAAGKSPEGLSVDITSAYGKYLVKPTAVVLVRRSSEYRAFIAGQVKNPGIIDMNVGRQTVLEGIASAGGATDTASLEHVVLVRTLPDHPGPIVMQLNLINALEGTHPEQNLSLLPNDLIYVPRSGAASVNLAMQQYILNNIGASTSFTLQKNIP